MPLEIEYIDTVTAPDDLLEELWLYYHEVYREELPDDPPNPLARVVADWRAIRDEELVPRWVLRNNGTIEAAGIAHAGLVENLDQGFVRVHVTAERRGMGHARLLAATLFDWLEEHDRTKIHTYEVEGAGLDEFFTRLGLKEAYHDQRSRLVVADVDRDMMRSWIDRAAERASDYEIVHFEAPIPEEMLDRYCDILFQMNTAPREDFEEDDETMTPERWRLVEANNEKAQLHLRTAVAVHRPSGVFAGSTSMGEDLLDPRQAWQWETVVHPDHRNLGLGRWLKASLFEKVVSERPDIVQIDTENSVTNDAMLSINLTMGFKPISRQVYWQGDLATVRSNWGV